MLVEGFVRPLPAKSVKNLLFAKVCVSNWHLI